MYINTNINNRNNPIFPIEPININRIIFQPQMQRPDGSKYHQFLWVTDGMGVFIANGQKKILSKGQGFFSRKGTPHTYYAAGDVFSTRWVTFFGGEQILDHYHIEDYMFFDVPDFLDKSTDRLSTLCSSSNDILGSAHMYTWICEFLNAHFSKNIVLSEKVRTYLEQNYNSNKSLEQIAEIFGTDKYALCHKFSKQTGTTISQTLKNIRISNAKAFLKGTLVTVENVGKMCGYESPSYFINVFREETGMTPKQYRERNNNDI